MMANVSFLDWAVHMGLEAIGGVILMYALGFCSHLRHRVLVWFTLAALFSYITVLIVG